MNNSVCYAASAALCVVSCLLCSLSASAEAPVVDASIYASQPTTQQDFVTAAAPIPAEESVGYATSTVPVGERIARLEHMVSDRNMNLMSQLNALQDEVRTLRGLIEVHEHDMAQLKQQQQLMYGDLDHRLANKQQATVLNDSVSNAVNPPNLDKHAAMDGLVAQEKDYQQAFQLLRDKHYSKAVSAMNDYIAHYPTGHYAANAHYWLGELFMLQGNTDQAVKQFNVVLSDFASNRKAADARLKLGFIFLDRGDYIGARSRFDEIVKRYPGSSTAQLAQARLDDLKKQGL